MRKLEGSKESKISRCFKAPLRFLIRAKRKMGSCAGNMSIGDYGNGMAYPAAHFSSSYSMNSSASANDEDLAELMRVASTKNSGLAQPQAPAAKKTEIELLRQQLQQLKRGSSVSAKNADAVPRSQSVAIGRIDEDEPCEFEEETKFKSDVYPRSRSYAVTKRRINQ